MSTGVIHAEAKLTTTKARLSPSYAYDSGWVAATQSNTTLVFSHNLGSIPTQLIIMFSPDQETAFPLTWPWNSWNSGNPATIKAKARTISIRISGGSPLHGSWDTNTGWTYWSTGYFRVFASP